MSTKLKLRFDGNLEYQAEAIGAVVELFEGQPLVVGEFTTGSILGDLANEIGYGNALRLSAGQLLDNLRRVQERNHVAPSAALEATPSLQGARDPRGGVPHYAIEMETGTGKTYVYLRTLYELHRRYGFSRFIIVVPSVAIREGVLKTIEVTKEHLGEIYGRPAVDAWVYDGKRASRVRQFATSTSMQIMIINIDAFNKTSNLFNQEQDRMSGRSPAEFVRQTLPIVVMDEPQNMESDTAQNAIKGLNPLCTLRYSATHRTARNLIYRLGPVQAYDQRLVKRIIVNGILDEDDFNKPYVEVLSFDASKKGVTANVNIDVQQAKGVTRKKVKLKKNGEDLYELSGERPLYRGWIVSEMNAQHGYIAFTNGQRVKLGQSSGGREDDVARVQIRQTIKEHLDKELQIMERPEGQRLKVLSLFFIDRVAHYADEDGKYRRWFVEEYEKLRGQATWRALNLLPADKVHNGYFSQDRKGRVKDTRGDSQDDEDTYNLIMRDKERLLSRDEPLRFIFSHSALREGWDNPNVFQICTLNETKSDLKKRQEIGRGLRLPVLETGARCFDESINALNLIVNESYEAFAQALQIEIQEGTGESFEGRITDARKRRSLQLHKPLPAEFHALWERIRHRTRYEVVYETSALIAAAVKAIDAMPEIHAPGIVMRTAKLDVTTRGVGVTVVGVEDAPSPYESPPIPDLLSYLQERTRLTRRTLAEILTKTGRLDDAPVNPQVFLEQVERAINTERLRLLVEGIKYVRLTPEQVGDAAAWSTDIFPPTLDVYEQKLVDTLKSIYDAVPCDSAVESTFAAALEVRQDVSLFLKLPRNFKVDTPLGSYSPDWAIVLKRDERVYLVRETKGSKDLESLRPGEKDKISCGKRHFAVLGVDFDVVTRADEVR